MDSNSDCRECELKFKASADDLDRFKAAVQAVTGNDPVWTQARLKTRYFDTADNRLGLRGVSLRVRQKNGSRVQTVKTAGNGGGLMDRDEWEIPLQGDEPDLSALPVDARRALGTVAEGELSPVIAVDAERQTLTLHRQSLLGPELVVEAALDDAMIMVGNRSERFAECELELVRGEIGAFFQLAAEIADYCPLPLSRVSKAGRGYRLLHDQGSAAVRVPKFELTGGMTVHQALTQVFTTCVGNIMDNEEACLTGTDPEGVHQMRVSLRRLRSSLRVFAPFIDRGRVAWMDADLKWLAASLGPARDWDVYISETLTTVDSYGIDRQSIAALRERAEVKRQAAYDAVRATLGSERYARMMFRLSAFVAMEGWLARPLDPRDPLLKSLNKTAAGILRRPYRKVIRAGADMANLDLEARHDVRIRLKKLRYAVDFLQAVYPGAETRKFTRLLRNLQEAFGKLNDVAQAMRLTDEQCRAADGEAIDANVLFAAGQVRGWFAHTLRSSGPQLVADWEAFAATRPFWEARNGSARTAGA